MEVFIIKILFNVNWSIINTDLLKMIRLLMPYDHSDAFEKPEIKNIWDDINRILNKHDEEVKKIE